jgi:uncharacterized protein (TIGR02246 family)
MTSHDPSALAARTLADLEHAWNLADGTAYGAAFADDTDFVDIRGGHHRGRGAVATGHQALFTSVYANSVISYRLDTARVAAPGCVVVVADASLDTPMGPAAGVHRSRLTAVLTEHGGVWSIAAFHNAPVRAGA